MPAATLTSEAPDLEREMHATPLRLKPGFAQRWWLSPLRGAALAPCPGDACVTRGSGYCPPRCPGSAAPPGAGALRSGESRAGIATLAVGNNAGLDFHGALPWKGSRR